MYLLWESYSYLLLPVTGFLVFSFLAFFTILRGKRSSTNILFACICFLGALIDLDIAQVSFLADQSLSLRLDRLSYLFFVFVTPVYIQFVHAFLGTKKRRWLEGIAYLFSMALLPFTQTEYFIRGLRQFSFGRIAEAGPVYYVFSVAGGIAALYCIATLFWGMKRARENSERNRIKYVCIGFGLSGLLIFLNSLPISGYDIYPMGNFNFIPAIILAFGVLKYDLLDIGMIIRKGSAYFFLTGILTFIYALAIYLANLTFIGYGHTHPLIISFISAALVVALFNPLKIRVQKLVDGIFFRGEYDYQGTLKQVSGAMASFLRLEEIIDLMLDSIASALKTKGISVAVYHKDTASLKLYSHKRDPLGRKQKISMEKSRPVADFFEEYRKTLGQSIFERIDIPDAQKSTVSDLFNMTGATILIPMISRGELMGIIALGEKKSGKLFVHEDIELLETIANQGAIAIENAKNYERIAEVNIELEEKVKKRTEDLAAALEEKERTQQQLIRSESLASIGQLVAGTAHELNNPLASASSLVQTSVETIRHWEDVQGRDCDELIEDLQFSLRELDRAANIVKSLLDLSRQTQTYVEPVNINILIDDALRVLRNRYKRLKITIEKELGKGLPEIEGNFANLGQVVINIINNAIQAFPDGKGMITLVTRYDEERDVVRIECHDTGEGMSPEEVRDAFKPFFTTKKPGEGTGLGLYISHEIVKRHEGNITIQSVKGEGTVVSVELPCRRRYV
ncbi:MAG TPA: ATP-binding protein [Syntrophales bacterium]|nr:ATP-binding protein [Syntrophales bacterium]HPQ44794.1 ATP-binding protein [Syntrophales bacterium]